ncbi:hypothetical protein JZ751_017746 [Albula glossodonta]|uniref:Uncharacterized protein n=1 Tax=Albula glossodonta TaxID=121402 RepID=A0A8T2PPA2_9TELE|nr:hypothetical protein JZ751_017746 [Albula glossodonta]
MCPSPRAQPDPVSLDMAGSASHKGNRMDTLLFLIITGSTECSLAEQVHAVCLSQHNGSTA